MGTIPTSRRRLPHLYPEEGWLFITWHLKGSLPKALYPPPGKRSAGKAFAWMDRYLDTTRNGPKFLRHPEVARLIVEALEDGSEHGLYDLRAFVVMANHVHVLLRPKQEPGRVLQWLKEQQRGKPIRSCPAPVSRSGNANPTTIG